MSFDFPSSPTEGQIYAPPGGPRYQWNSPVWDVVGDAVPVVVDSVKLSETLTSNPLPIAGVAQLYIDSVDGTLKLIDSNGVVKTVVVEE